MPRRPNTGPFHTSTTIEIPDGENWLQIDVDIEFGVNPYDPGDWYNPPSGGGIDYVNLKITKVAGYNPEGNEIILTKFPSITTSLDDFILKHHKTDIDRAIEYALEHMEPEDDGDAAYDRWKDEQAEKRQ